jgi:hypothetical protein
MALTGTTNVDIFRDLITGTTSTVYTGPEQIVNDATRFQNYYTRFELSGGKSGDLIQAGPEIIDHILLSVPQVAQFYNPDNGTFSYQRHDVLSNWTLKWRFLFTHWTYTDHEIVLNTGGLTGGALKEKLKEIRRGKEMANVTDLVDTIEATAWAAPNASTMEEATGTQPHSNLCFITELATGLPTGYTTAGATTVMGINPATKTNWTNQRQTYADLPKADTDLFRAFSLGTRKAMWQQLPYKAEMSQGPKVNGFTFFTDSEGLANYEDSLRLAQDEFKNGSSGQDPDYGAPTFRGIPFIYIAALDGAAVWPTGASGAAATSATTTNSNAGPRYLGMTREHIKCVWHSAMYMHAHPEIRPDSQPHVHVMPTDTWLNRVCTSRRRHLIVYPSANLS